MNIIPWITRLTGRVKVLETAYTPVIASGTTTPIAITADQARRGVVVSNLGATGAVEFDLPAAVAGMSITAHVHVAQNLALDPAAADKIITGAGVDLTAGVPTLANAVGEFITLRCFEDGTWQSTVYSGTWDADGTP